jgi:hypothetical protein
MHGRHPLSPARHNTFPRSGSFGSAQNWVISQEELSRARAELRSLAEANASLLRANQSLSAALGIPDPSLISGVTDSPAFFLPRVRPELRGRGATLLGLQLDRIYAGRVRRAFRRWAAAASAWASRSRAARFVSRL